MQKSVASLCICLSCWTSGCLSDFLSYHDFLCTNSKCFRCVCSLRKCFYLHCRATCVSNRCMKAWPHVVPSVLDSCSLVQEALCACSEEKKESLSQWGFCYLGWRAQETLTKYLDPLCLKYLSIALDTMSTNASSVCYSSLFPLHPSKIFSGFYKGYYFLSRHLGKQIWLVLLY